MREAGGSVDSNGAGAGDNPRVAARLRIKIVVAIVVLAVFVLVGRRYFGELERLRDVAPTSVAVLVLLFAAARLVQGRTVQVVLARLGHSAGLRELFLLNVLMSYTNLLLPRIGLSAPALYLKRRHGVSFAEFSSLLLPMVVLHVVGVGILGLICLGILRYTTGGPVNLHVTALFVAVVVGGLVALTIRVNVPARWSGRIANFLRRLMESWCQLGRTRTFVVHMVLLRMLLLCLRVIRLYVCFRAVSDDVSFVGVFVAQMLSDLAFLISVTPAGIGFNEAAVTYSASMVGCAPAVALSAAILDRLVTTACVVIVAQIAIWKLIRPLGPLEQVRDEAPSRSMLP